jgi:RIO-like serine/threonine protein kinase
MGKIPILDFVKLEERIIELLKKVPSSLEVNNSSTDYRLKGIISELIFKHVTSKSGYWESTGIKMHTEDSFMKCKAKYAKLGKIIGQGAFGIMMNVPSPTCLPTIPKNVPHVAMKFETLQIPYDRFQSPEQVAEAYEISKRAAELGIGPKIYDSFVTLNDSGYAQIVKVFELLEGASWVDTEWKSDEEKKKALTELRSKIKTMNEAGIIHHDLHGGNIMVTSKGDIYIVDFDRANFVNREEINTIRWLNDSVPNPDLPSDPLLQDKVTDFIYNTLYKEGSILVAGDVKRKTRRNKKSKQ